MFIIYTCLYVDNEQHEFLNRGLSKASFHRNRPNSAVQEAASQVELGCFADHLLSAADPPLAQPLRELQAYRYPLRSRREPS